MLPKGSVAFPVMHRWPCAAVRVEQLYGDALRCPPTGHGCRAISRS